LDTDEFFSYPLVQHGLDCSGLLVSLFVYGDLFEQYENAGEGFGTNARHGGILTGWIFVYAPHRWFT
jgi:hypothetical protein